jgi:myotubularin-related protein 1/2
MPVLVHCSHGWDRTSQVAALAQLFLDPFYRTRQGFSVLVEKDFMSFGHPFHTRCAHGEGRNGDNNKSSSATQNDEGQISPIFLQFLDCVFQVVQLYPECFEFNTNYLLEFSFHVYSCRFGSMLCDTEREREVLAGIRQRTYSVWDYLDGMPELKNENYQKSDGVLLMPLPTLLRNVKLWADRHCKFGPKATFRRLDDDAFRRLDDDAMLEPSSGNMQ